MADFRRWFYAFAVIVVLTGLAVPAAAQLQNPPFQCVANAAVPPIVRAEGYTELVGDLTLNCTGGVPTPAGQIVPQVNVTIFLSTNVTSKFLQGGLYNEALLIIDEPNSAVNPARPILNCGNTGAPDAGPSGPAVCSIYSTGNPSQTYDGNTAGNPGGTGACDGVDPDGAGILPARPASATAYGCGRPNVFQGRITPLQNAGQFNAVTWNGVPLDPPGTTTNRTIRITNVRANAVAVGVSSTFATSQILMNIAVNGNTSLSINNPTQIVAFVQRGLTGGVQQANLNFIQCNDENGALFNGTTVNPFGGTSAFNSTTVPPQPLIRFAEGFASSWKVKNVSFDLGSGSGNTITGGNANFIGSGYVYNGSVNYPADAWQNVPGAIYNTESGFEFSGSGTANSVTGSNPSPNPPIGFGTFTVSANTNQLASRALNNTATDTGIAGAGVASQGTRLAIAFTNIPQGASVFVPPVVYLQRQFVPYPGTPTFQTNFNSATSTGVMVLTSTNADGSGAFSRRTSGNTLQAVSGGLAVYEILYADPFALEYVDVPVVVAFVSNLSQNLPQVGVTAQAATGFAPFFTSTAAGQPQTTATSGVGSVPRFIPGQTPQNLFLISKCACNLLFPYVVSAAGYDTGIAIANASLDPGPTFGFFAVPQSGTVTFFYFGQGNGGTAPPAAQTTNKVVPAGQVLTYVASSGNADFGLDNRAAGFVGYVITQSQFQYCHAFAFIGALGAGAITPGNGTISEGYLGIQIDLGGLTRTNQLSENKAH